MTHRMKQSAIVFTGKFDEHLLTTVEQPVQTSRTMFDTIGKIASSTASEPIEAVVIDDALLENNPEENIDSIRRIDPTIIVIVSSNTVVHQADACVPKMPTAALLRSAIENVHSEPELLNTDIPIDLDTVLGIADEIKLEHDSSPLGDVDLVRCLMHSPAKFKETLVNLLKEQTKWSYCAIVSAELDAPETSQVSPLRYGHNEHGFIAAIGSTTEDLLRWSRWAACWLDLARRQRELKLLAYQDELSGAWNRRFLRTCLSRELQIARNTRRPLTVMIFDIDDFKHYNDRWGHDAGDEIIRELVKLLRAIIRKGDHVCRIGGDEFAVLFCDPEPPREPGSDHPTTIEILAKRFKEQVAKARFPKLGEEATGVLSISGGLATFPWDSSDIDGLLEKADQRLLQSKRQGKNSITIGRDNNN